MGDEAVFMVEGCYVTAAELTRVRIGHIIRQQELGENH